MTYPNDFERTHFASQIVRKYGEIAQPELERLQHVVSVAGRLMSSSAAGNGRLAVLLDQSGSLEILVSPEATGKRNHAHFADWNPGAIIGVTGTVFRRDGGQIAVRAHEIERLVKPVRGLPQEPGSQSYLGLLLNPRSRSIFALRCGLVSAIRGHMHGTAYLEVETPVLQPSPDGRAPGFITHHNALDRDLYLRVSGDAFLKRLLVGGMEKVYEIGRRFVNEPPGGSAPVEATVVEVYSAYSSYQYMMVFVEQLLARSVGTALGTTAVSWRGETLDFARRFQLVARAADQGEGRFIQPTLVVDDAAEFFEIHVGGRKIGEGRSEVNDPDALADSQDADFVRAVEYGLPPAAGLTVWIDRLVMALTDSASPEEVVLFPSHGGR